MEKTTLNFNGGNMKILIYIFLSSFILSCESLKFAKKETQEQRTPQSKAGIIKNVFVRQQRQRTPKQKNRMAIRGFEDLIQNFKRGTGKQLYGANLQNANMNGRRMMNTNFEKGDLRGATFEKADLMEAKFFETKMHGAKFKEAKIVNADLRLAKARDADFQKANLSLSVLDGADFRGADFRGARIRTAWLTNADCRGADFRGADFYDADLRGTNFDGAKFEGADLTKTKIDRKNSRHIVGAKNTNSIYWANKKGRVPKLEPQWWEID